MSFFGEKPSFTRKFRLFLSLVLVFLTAALTVPVLAAEPGPFKIMKAFGQYNNSPRLILDGQIPEQGSAWNGDGCVWWEADTVYFIVDLGGDYRVENLLLQVDNNDDYRVEYSPDGKSFHSLVSVSQDFGEIGDGMDTMSSDPASPDFIEGLKFSPVTARYLKISGLNGDNAYAVSEVQVTGAPVPVDEIKPGLAVVTSGYRITGVGEYKGDLKLFRDSKFAEEGSDWQGDGCVFWTDKSTCFVIDLGKLRKIRNITLQVDNNDDYQLGVSSDGNAFSPMLTVSGDIGEMGTGMDTMSTDPQSPYYVKGLNFIPRSGRYVKVYAVDGDNMYAISEIQFQFAPASAPGQTKKVGE